MGAGGWEDLLLGDEIMLTDVMKVAVRNWQEFTGSDLEILFEVSFDTAKAAAEIAREMGHVDVANAILEKALHP